MFWEIFLIKIQKAANQLNSLKFYLKRELFINFSVIANSRVNATLSECVNGLLVKMSTAWRETKTKMSKRRNI